MPPKKTPQTNQMVKKGDHLKRNQSHEAQSLKTAEKERLSKHDNAVIIRKSGKLKRMHFVKIQLLKSHTHTKAPLIKKTKPEKTKIKKQTKRFNLKGYFTKKRLKWIGFFVLLVFSIINIIYMTLRFTDNNYEYRIFSYANIEAVLPNQDITQPVRTGVVLLRKIDLNTIQPGDYVVVCCDFNIEGTNWVERVISVDLENQTLRTSYDEIFQITVTLDEVYGQYVRTSGPIGTLYYSATFLRGYLLLIFGHIIIQYGYFYVVIKKRKDTFFRDR